MVSSADLKQVKSAFGLYLSLQYGLASLSKSESFEAHTSLHLVDFLIEMLHNRSFTMKTSDGKVSQPRKLKNRFLQGLTLASLLFNVYISDLPQTIFKQYGCAACQ